MTRIDAHQHFWKFDPVRDTWITEEMSAIRRDFLPEDLEPHLKRAGFDGCVAVQADQSEGENAFLIQLAEKHEFIKSVVGWVDLQAANLEERLQYYKGVPKMKGFRHILQGEPRRDLMLKPSFKKGIECLRRYDFTFDLLILPDQLKYAKELIGELSEQLFVIDHMAKPSIRGGAIEEWKNDMQAFRDTANVFCKVSGMVTEADWQHWNKEEFRQYLDVVVDVFGTQRLMFGSDYPVCLTAATYEEVYGIVADYFSSFSESEQNAIFGMNAGKFYCLEKNVNC